MKKAFVGIAFGLLMVLPAGCILATAHEETTLSIQILGGLPITSSFSTAYGVIINTGETPAYNVSYTFTITGGPHGDINTTDAGDIDEIPSGIGVANGLPGVSGFGPVILTMTASASNADTVTRSVKGIQLGRFSWVPLSWIIPPLFQRFFPWLDWNPTQ